MDRLRRSRVTNALVLVGALSIVAAACSGDDDSGAVAEMASAEILERAAFDAATGSEAASPALDAPATVSQKIVTNPVVSAIELGRDIIYTADVTVAVSDIADNEHEAIAIAASVGGFLFGQQTVGAPEAHSTLIFKVPPERFEEALRRLGDLGTVRFQSVRADDVTERVVDLESRIRSAEASVERLNFLLTKATDIKAITELEAQLLERETALETLRGQLRTLRDRVEFATISIILVEALSQPAVALVVTAYPGSDPTGVACPGEGALSVIADEPATICLEVTNTGATPLRNFDLTDPVLGITTEDLVVVFGDPSATMLPGQSMVFAVQVTVERDIRSQTTLNATPVDDQGRPVEARSIASVAGLEIVAEDPGGLPGFHDGLNAGAQVIEYVSGAVVLGTGLVLPLLPLLLLAGFFLFWRRRRNRASSDVTA